MKRTFQLNDYPNLWNVNSSRIMLKLEKFAQCKNNLRVEPPMITVRRGCLRNMITYLCRNSLCKTTQMRISQEQYFVLPVQTESTEFVLLCTSTSRLTQTLLIDFLFVGVLFFLFTVVRPKVTVKVEGL